jgi:hypothetical protein
MHRTASTMALVSVACADYGSSSGLFSRDDSSRVQSGFLSVPLFSDLSNAILPPAQ